MQSYQLGEQICQEPAPLPNASIIWQKRRLWLENTPAKPDHSPALGQNCPIFV